MKILVTVNEVASPDDEFEIDGVGIDERYLSYDLNEWDEYALEEAVQLAESGTDVEVVTVTIGPERAEETIRQALAKGADRAVRIWGDQLAAEPVLDSTTKARLLAAVVRDEEPELVLSGVQSADTAFGATGVTLASTLDFQWAAVVNDVELGAETVTVHRELEGGLEELTEVTLPAVLSIQTGINEPRYASLRGIRRAQQKPIDVYTPATLGVESIDPAVELTSLSVPETESEATFFEGDAGETAGELGEVLRERGVGS